jgi:hypothetical protein
MVGEYDTRMPRSHRRLLVVLALGTALFAGSLIQVRRPSPFASGSGYGVGWGAMGMMFGASPRPGAAR